MQALAPEDLVRLNDIGSSTTLSGTHIFTLSPDRRRVAFQLRRADPATNSYALSMIVMDVRAGATPTIVDQGGELIRMTGSALKGVRMESGIPETVTPHWAPDGSAIYFLKRTAGSVQVWKAAVDGTRSERMTGAAGDVEAFTLTPDGRRLIFATATADPEAQRQLGEEALRGYRYDERFLPISGSVPTFYVQTQRTILALDLHSGTTQAVSAGETIMLDNALAGSGRNAAALSQTGRAAWSEEVTSGGYPSTTELHAEDALSREQKCPAVGCAGPSAISWSADGRRVRYLRREGWGNSQMAIYEWTPGDLAPRRLYVTEDLLIDCQPFGDFLLCARERSATPRQLILLDPVIGEVRIIFDPNPNFNSLRLGKVERLRLLNVFGIESYGDLVYPVDYVPGRRYPLIVVQYVARGFLRGGVGDEVPIQALANRGFAILSVQRPDARQLARGATDGRDFERRTLATFKDRRSVLSSIERMVAVSVRRGIVDPARIGITGLSDGSSTVQFAAINSRVFAAASVSGCCWAPEQDALLGPAGADLYHTSGWPKLIDNNLQFWSRMSLVANARKIKMPLLFQQSDDEFRAALTSFVALRQAGTPTMLYVFPGEHHVKWQPAHRLAVYERNIQWFDFWLNGREVAVPVDPDQYLKWRALKPAKRR